MKETEEHRRPDPDALLAEIKRTENKKGKLKILAQPTSAGDKPGKSPAIF